jgi:hypothetical protein
MTASIKINRFVGLLFTLISLVPLMNSCEVANDLIGNKAVAELEGDWNCEEESEYFKKSTTTPESYQVAISPDPDNENGIIIYGFYQLNDVGVKAGISGMTITLQEQPAGNVTVLSGSGIISSNYKTINWSYSVNIGGDAVDHATAVYTKVN